MIEVPVEACEAEVVPQEATPEAAPEATLEVVQPAPKRRGRPRKVPPRVDTPAPAEPAEPAEPIEPIEQPPTPAPKVKAKPQPKPRAPPPSPRPLHRVPEERYPQAFDDISSTELVAELLARRANANRDSQRQMFRSWLS